MSTERHRGSETAAWYRDAFVILHLDHHTREDMPVGRDADPGEVERLIRLADPDVVQMHAKGNPGWTTYPTTIGFTPPKLERDVMEVWTDVSKRVGKPFSAYYNIGRDGEIMLRKPHFNRLDAGGNLQDRAICYHSGVAEEYLWPMIREIIERYHPVGFWFDGSNFTVRTCYCDVCLKRWNANSDRDAPRSPADPDWDRYCEMQRDIYHEFVAGTIDFIHALDPECQVAVNWAYTFRMPEKPPEGLAYLTGDAANDVERLTTEAAIMDNQGIPFDLMTTVWYRPADLGNRDLSPAKPDPQLQQEAAIIISHGGRYNAWDTPTDSSGLVVERIEAVSRLVKWLRPRQEFCLHTENVPDVSVLRLPEEHYARSREKSGCFAAQDPDGPVENSSAGLDDAHITYDITPAWRLDEGSVRGPVLLLEDPCLLSKRRVGQLAELVESGVTLLVTGAAAVVGGPELRRLAGIKTAQLIGLPEDSRLSVRASDGHSRGSRAVLEPGWPLYVTDLGDAEALLAAELPPGAGDAEDASQPKSLPLLSLSSRGAGKVYYCAVPLFFGAFSRAKEHGATPDATAQLTRLVLEAVLPGRDRTVTTDAPTSIQITCRRRGPMRVVHLVNRAPGDRSTGGERGLSRCISSLPPAPACSLSIRSEKKPASVLVEPDSREVDWSYENGRVNLTMPEFAVHQMVVLRA